LLILSSLPSEKDKEKAVANRLPCFSSVPYTVPSTASISAASGLGEASDKYLRGLDDQSSSIKPTASETIRAKLSTIIRSSIEGRRGQSAAAAFIKSQDEDGESSDINTDPKPVVSISNFQEKKVFP
jgi:hypothetical protein